MTERTSAEDADDAATAGAQAARGGRLEPSTQDDGAHPRTGWARAAAAVCLLHAVALVGLAVFYGVELVRGEGSSATNVALSLALILVFAALMVLLARVWAVGSTRAVVPTVVWNGLLIPVVVALYGADVRLPATALLVLVVAGIGSAVLATARSRSAG